MKLMLYKSGARDSVASPGLFHGQKTQSQPPTPTIRQGRVLGLSGVGRPEGGVSAAAAAKSLQSCPTLCDPIDGSPPGSPVPGILQAGTLEWVAISFSRA